MIIKDLNYGILIFEANSNSGVSLTPWKYVVKFEWYKTIPKYKHNYIGFHGGDYLMLTETTNLTLLLKNS